MNSNVEQAVNALRETFPHTELAVEDDGAGGAYVRIEPIELGPRFAPQRTWVGGHLPPQLPYADVYPLFIGSEVARADGATLSAPITAGHSFRGRPALQISRRTNRLDPTVQTAALKFQKVLHWLRNIP
jgi:hypothetical protein